MLVDQDTQRTVHCAIDWQMHSCTHHARSCHHHHHDHDHDASVLSSEQWDWCSAETVYRKQMAMPLLLSQTKIESIFSWRSPAGKNCTLRICDTMQVAAAGDKLNEIETGHRTKLWCTILLKSFDRRLSTSSSHHIMFVDGRCLHGKWWQVFFCFISFFISMLFCVCIAVSACFAVHRSCCAVSPNKFMLEH